MILFFIRKFFLSRILGIFGLSFLFIFTPLFSSSTEVILVEFQPFKSKEDPKLAGLISQKLAQSIQNKGFSVKQIKGNEKTSFLNNPKSSALFLVHGYYSRSKTENLNLYVQIYRPDTGEVIDGLTINDDLLDSLEFPLTKDEIRTPDNKRLEMMSDKISMKLQGNKNRKPQIESIEENIVSTPISKEISFPIAKVSEAEQSAEVFKLIQENEINRKVEVASLFKEDDLVAGSTVGVVDEKQWKKYGARRTSEAVQYMPGTFVPGYVGGVLPIVIRGYTTTQSISGVATLVDGVPVNTFSNSSAMLSLPNFGLGTLNRIEMIRGPGSAIYGSDAFHGVYSLKTFESKENRSSVAVEHGDLGYSQGNVKLSHSLSEKWRIHVAASSLRQRDNLQASKVNTLSIDPLGSSFPAEYRSPFPSPLNQYRPIHDLSMNRRNQYTSDTAVIKLEYQATDKLSFKLGTYASSYFGQGFPGLGTRSAYNQDLSNQDSKFYMGNFSANYKIGDTMEADIMLYGWKSKAENSYNLYARAPVSDFLTFFSGYNENRYGGSISLKQEKNSFNTQWIISASSSVNHIVDTRLETSAKKREDLALNLAFGVVAGFKFGKHPYDGLSRRIQSAFFQTKTGFWNNRIYLLLGGRYDKYSDFGNQSTPRIGLIFMLEEKTSLKLLYGKAFRAPAAPDLTSNSIVKGSPTIQPEIIDSYEMILMNKGKEWKAELILFQNYWKNAIIAVQNPNLSPPFQAEYGNRGQNESHGAEFDFQYFFKEFQMMLGGASVISKDITKPDPFLIRGSDLAINPLLFINPNESGNRYTLFPRKTLTQGLGYNWAKRNLNFYLLHRWMSGMKDKAYGNTVNSTDIKSFSRFDLIISSKVNENLQFHFVVRNLLNRNNHIPGAWGTDYGFRDETVNGSVQLEYIF